MDKGNDAFSFDKSAVEIFSLEERNDIAARIEAASVREAVKPPGLPSKEQAMRRGIFPLLVNAGAFVLLLLGLFLLFSFQRADEAEIRESGAVLDTTARALIKEIRKEVTLQLNEKEAAINAMNKRIEGADEELRRLEKLESLSDEQRSAMEKLQGEREESLGELARLQAERARIVTEAHNKETETIQNEERARLTEKNETRLLLSGGLYQSDSAEMRSAREEFASLSSDNQRTDDSALEELRKNVTDLQQLYAAAQQTITDKDRQIADKDRQMADKDRQMENIREQNTSYARSIEALQNTIARLRAALDE